MKPIKVLVSLLTADNDYQKEQAAAAMEAARRHEMTVDIVYADNDAVNQSQQLLKAIQNRAGHPDAVVVEPVGTGMPQVAAAAAAAGIGWGIVNREVDYVERLRQTSHAPVFAISTDQQEVGRIQGRQFSGLLKRSGGILYIEGPGIADATRLRTAGMLETKPENASIKTLKADWTEAGAYKIVKSWLSLSTSRQLHIELIGCQNDAMAAGARKAFEDLPNSVERDQWLKLPLTGCDGVPGTGQKWVQQGWLTATVITPPTMGIAVEILRNAIQTGSQPPERTLSAPRSYPSLEKLAETARH
jgi:ABC-type sugar transport system substrate-binding protein